MLIGHVVVLGHAIQVCTIDAETRGPNRPAFYDGAFYVRTEVSDQRTDLLYDYVEYILKTFLPGDFAQGWVLNILVIALADQGFAPKLYPLGTDGTEAETF